MSVNASRWLERAYIAVLLFHPVPFTMPQRVLILLVLALWLIKEGQLGVFSHISTETRASK